MGGENKSDIFHNNLNKGPFGFKQSAYNITTCTTCTTTYSTLQDVQRVIFFPLKLFGDCWDSISSTSVRFSKIKVLCITFTYLKVELITADCNNYFYLTSTASVNSVWKPSYLIFIFKC